MLDLFGLVPWLLALDRTRTLRGAAASGLGMCVAFVAAIFAWFGYAIAVYSAGAAAAGFVVLLVSAPLLQPQFIVFAVVRFIAGRHYGVALRTLLGASAWVATEWMFPKLLADTLAHGMYPSVVLRQFADVAGTAGITFLLVVINECLCASLSPQRRAHGLRASLVPIAAAASIVAGMAGYGTMRLAALEQAAVDDKPVRVGLVQSNIAAYDRLRREMGAYEAVRHVLDTHFMMSRGAVEQQKVDALMWSETVFPTTFGKPKSDTGGELDREITDFVSKMGVPLVFGSYDRDDLGEYNSAVFLEPAAAGVAPRFDTYRKTRLFLLTEYVPAWMDGSLTREWMPWAGNWLPGPGARVLPLRLADGREVPVLPMICLDDVDAGLAIEGARLGARMILTMSNDSWFTEHTGGAHLHLVAAAFRSIETHLPQLRVTNNGITAVIDASGEIVDGAAVGERRTVIADLSPRAPGKTLMVRWGDWLGPVALGLVVLVLSAPYLRERRKNRHG
ncbi:MAG: apolipoprotein N-acyltransferase [Candidatus Binatia bacterium]